MFPPNQPAAPELAENQESQPTIPSPALEQPEPTDQTQFQLSDEDEKQAFENLLQYARRDDWFVRDQQLRLWKRLEYYWNNILDIFLDPVAKEWRVPDWEQLESDGELPPRLINIYRPLGEAVIAALSVSIPPVNYHPDDADNPDDVETARAMRHINELIASHDSNDMLFIRALTVAFNQGTIFGYNYYHTDPKFGTIPKPKIESVDIQIFTAHCPQCGEPLDGGVQGMQEQSYNCPDCGYQGPAEVGNSIETIPQVVGFDHTPKGTVKREIYSGLNIKVPAYAKDQDNCGYLLLEFAQSAAMLRYIYKDDPEKMKLCEPRYNSSYDSFAKLPIYYLGQQPENAANVSCLWLRPWQFYEIAKSDFEVAKALEQKYPDGCYAIYINDTYAEAYSENMDEHWSISKNPLGQFVYSRPLGENLATIQDIRASLVEIELQTAEYGIPETFADERVLDFNKYGAGRAQPGMVTPVKPRPGKSIGDAFFTTKSAILSQEIDPMRQHLDQDAQLASGAFPSVYGGVSSGGSKTAAEYEQSKNMALQRLNITWKIVCDWWARFQSRSATEYANVIKTYNMDEKYTSEVGKGNYVNNWIRRSSLNGRIGRVEPEASDQLPVSWSQKQDMIFKLFALKDPAIQTVLTNPNNSSFMKDVVGLEEMYIPGEEDRIKQLREWQQLSQGMMVQINPEVDNEEIHIDVLKYMIQTYGDQLEEQGMSACMQHLMMHEQSNAQKAAQAMASQGNDPNQSQSGSPAPANEQQGNVNV